MYMYLASYSGPRIPLIQNLTNPNPHIDVY